jgi:hypothetical protein
LTYSDQKGGGKSEPNIPDDAVASFMAGNSRDTLRKKAQKMEFWTDSLSGWQYIRDLHCRCLYSFSLFQEAV